MKTPNMKRKRMYLIKKKKKRKVKESKSNKWEKVKGRGEKGESEKVRKWEWEQKEMRIISFMGSSFFPNIIYIYFTLLLYKYLLSLSLFVQCVCV